MCPKKHLKLVFTLVWAFRNRTQSFLSGLVTTRSRNLLVALPSPEWNELALSLCFLADSRVSESCPVTFHRLSIKWTGRPNYLILPGADNSKRCSESRREEQCRGALLPPAALTHQGLSFSTLVRRPTSFMAIKLILTRGLLKLN